MKTHISLLMTPLLAVVIPNTVSGQGRSGVTLFDPVPSAGFEACAAQDGLRGDTWNEIVATRRLDKDAAKETLRAIEASLRERLSIDSSNVETQYLLAAAIGSRANIEGGRGKVSAAKDLHRQAQAVLALSPGHPGALHLLGRLHAAVLRMDRVTSFLATRILGGGELAGANWSEARLFLEAAAAGDPCVPDHHYELARLYAGRGEVLTAQDRLTSLFRVAGERDLYRDVVEKGHSLLSELERGN